MIWQDIVLAIGSWIFIVALVPALIGKDKPPVSSSALTGAVLAVYVMVYLTLHLWISVASTTILSIAWLTLAVQKHRSK
jgi:hypothetical protein